MNRWGQCNDHNYNAIKEKLTEELASLTTVFLTEYVLYVGAYMQLQCCCKRLGLWIDTWTVLHYLEPNKSYTEANFVVKLNSTQLFPVLASEECRGQMQGDQTSFMKKSPKM
jgi:hypothetical protein